MQGGGMRFFDSFRSHWSYKV